LEWADGVTKFAGHSTAGAMASLSCPPGIEDPVELDIESVR